MKKSNPDKLFKDIIESNHDYFESEATEAGQRIWNNIKLPERSTDRKSAVIKILAAACILLLFFSSILWYTLKKEQVKTRNLTHVNITEPDKTNHHLIAQTDTIYIREYRYDTIVETVEKVITTTEYLTEVIYKTDTVFKIPEKPVMHDDFAVVMKQEKSYEIKENVNDQNTKAKNKKNRRFTVKIGGNKDNPEYTRFAFQN